MRSQGLDWYTGEALAWEKISTYNNDESKADRSIYKAGFALLPTVDHVLRGDGAYDFVICGWRTNDAKNDLSLSEFLKLCRLVIARHGREPIDSLRKSDEPSSTDQGPFSVAGRTI